MIDQVFTSVDFFLHWWHGNFHKTAIPGFSSSNCERVLIETLGSAGEDNGPTIQSSTQYLDKKCMQFFLKLIVMMLSDAMVDAHHN